MASNPRNVSDGGRREFLKKAAVLPAALAIAHSAGNSSAA
ncbi:MAG: twin-arginine translocation signal domain-containing protein, partial [Planctomycetes bacterium]|nr:twin-arginine translocation signal domain-containing protein [Planctomycetota bacterium]